MMTDLARKIKQIEDLVGKKEIPTPEWPDVEIFARKITGEERDLWEAKGSIKMDKRGNVRNPNLRNRRAEFAVLICVDADGKRVFGPGDIEWLTKKNARTLDRIWDVGHEYNGMSPMETEDIEELEKNSLRTLGDGSGSSSADNSDAPPMTLAAG